MSVYVAPSWWSHEPSDSSKVAAPTQNLGKHGPRTYDNDAVKKALKEQMEQRNYLQNEQRRQEKAETLAYLARERELAEDEARKATASVALKKMQFRSDLDYQIQQRQMSKQRQHEEKYHDLEAQNDSLAAWKREQEQEKAAKRAQMEQFHLERRQAVMEGESKRRELALKKQADDRQQLAQFGSSVDDQDTKRREFFQKIGGAVTERKQQPTPAAPKGQPAHITALLDQMAEKKRRIQAEKDADKAYAEAIQMQIAKALQDEEQKKRDQREKNRAFRGFLEEQISHHRTQSRSQPW